MTHYKYRVSYYSTYQDRFGEKHYELMVDHWVDEVGVAVKRHHVATDQEHGAAS